MLHELVPEGPAQRSFGSEVVDDVADEVGVCTFGDLKDLQSGNVRGCLAALNPQECCVQQGHRLACGGVHRYSVDERSRSSLDAARQLFVLTRHIGHVNLAAYYQRPGAVIVPTTP